MENVNLFKNIPLFEDFKTTELMNICMVAKAVSYPAGALIFKEKSKGDSLCVVKSGRVRVAKTDSLGEEHVLAYIRPGEYFGEISLIDRAPRSASVYADTDAEILTIQAQDFRNLIAGNKDIERKFYKSFTKVLCERLRVTNENLTFSREINKVIKDVESPE